VTNAVLIELDMSGEDEQTVRLRLDQEIPEVAVAGVRHVILNLGERRALQRATREGVASAHRELRAVGGRLVVVTDHAGARHCTRECPDMLVAATRRQAHAALGLRAA
jgi:hypothetical protein